MHPEVWLFHVLMFVFCFVCRADIVIAFSYVHFVSIYPDLPTTALAQLHRLVTPRDGFLHVAL